MLRCCSTLSNLPRLINSRAGLPAWLACLLIPPLLWRRIKNQILCLEKNFSFKLNKQTNERTNLITQGCGGSKLELRLARETGGEEKRGVLLSNRSSSSGLGAEISQGKLRVSRKKNSCCFGGKYFKNERTNERALVHACWLDLKNPLLACLPTN